MEHLKLKTRTKKGTLVKAPATIERKDGRIYFAKSHFALKNEIKSMKGSKWHGFLPEDGRKIWSVEDCARNNFHLDYLCGRNPHANWKQDLQHWEYDRPLMEHQKMMSDACLTYHYQILAADMGCVSGGAMIHCNFRGYEFTTSLRRLYHNYHVDAPLSVRGYCEFACLIGVEDVIYQGEKQTLWLTTEGGHELVATPDHEVCVGSTGTGVFKRMDTLTKNDCVMVMVPKGWGYAFEKVASVRPAGVTDVYDIKCEGPWHNFAANDIVVHNCGKTLSAIEVMEKSGAQEWWWVGPKSGLVAVEEEFEKWGLQIQPKVMTYDRLRIDLEKWTPGQPAPQGIVFDESSKLKSSVSKRSKAAQYVSDAIREEWGWDGYVILMSGTPSPKKPLGWFSQAEICYPGYLREGSPKAFEQRLAIFEKQHTDQGMFYKRVSWLDDEDKCRVCGQYADHTNHMTDELFGGGGPNTHEYKPSKNEVAFLYKRLKGMVIRLSSDVLDLPDLHYRTLKTEPTSTVKRVAKALVKSAPTAIQGLIWLRELSDGFQYREAQDGVKTCPVCEGKKDPECEGCHGEGEVPNMVRETKEIKTPKDKSVVNLLEENEDQGRIVFFAGFQSSVDRVVKLCHKQQWNVVKVDGRGWRVLPWDGAAPRKVKPMEYWRNMDIDRVAFVSHPESGGMGLTLTEARMAVFFSNDFKPESREQAKKRIHRPGMDTNKGAIIVDLIHLGTDEYVRDTLAANRRLELMTLGEIKPELENSI